MKSEKQNDKFIREILKEEYDAEITDFIENLYVKHYKDFYKIAYRILCSASDAEDAVQDSFMRIYKYIDRILKLECPEITPYCVSIVKSVALNIKRSGKKIFFSDFSENLIDSVVFSEGKDEVIFKIIENKKLYSLLYTLSNLEYSIVEYRVLDGLTFKKISQRVGLSEEATKKRYQRIIKKLREGAEERSN